MKKLIPILFLVTACNGSTPTPPTGECNVKPEDCESGQVSELCECVPVKPPEESSAVPSDYFTVERANEFFLSSSEDDGIIKRLQRLWHHGVVDIDHVTIHCNGAWGTVFSMQVNEARDFYNVGLDLHAEGRKFERNFNTVNHRCPEQPEFCGRVEVNKERWADYVVRFDAHYSTATLLQEEARQDAKRTGCNAEFDTIKGWCDLCGR